MKKTFYLFNPGRLSRKDNTLIFVPKDEDGNDGTPRYLPIEGVKELYIFGALDANSALYNFLGRNSVVVHYFDYHEHYTGSFMPRDYLLAGKVQIEQVLHYHKTLKRLEIAKAILVGAAYNMIRNMKYYVNRGRKLDSQIMLMEQYSASINSAKSIAELMGLEGNIRQVYYTAFDEILNEYVLNGRTKQPPGNALNALISFGNMMCYSLCLSQIYHTQLNPTISFLHEPGARRYSLALDIAEVFKPMLVDRTIFRLLNKREIVNSEFRVELNSCIMKEGAKRTFVRAFEDRLNKTIKHRRLGRSVSYRHLVRLECYKLSKHILQIEPYQAFKIWW